MKARGLQYPPLVLVEPPASDTGYVISNIARKAGRSLESVSSSSTTTSRRRCRLRPLPPSSSSASTEALGTQLTLLLLSLCSLKASLSVLVPCARGARLPFRLSLVLRYFPFRVLLHRRCHCSLLHCYCYPPSQFILSLAIPVWQYICHCYPVTSRATRSLTSLCHAKVGYLPSFHSMTHREL